MSAWNNLSREQMEAQLLRQAQTIGTMRAALEPFAKLASDFCEVSEVEGSTLTWVEFLDAYSWPSEQDCRAAQLALQPSSEKQGDGL
jgi:hypothetical protein